ncbi:MAG: DUF4124 domain-containing protein [Pseudomonadota bacterium]|nr:DUF4124 domain-containing protein [Pseudomonadota bacterium]
MHRSLIAVALLLLAPVATAQVYKWTDASGTVHYSEAPPSKGTEYKQVATTGTAAPRVAPAPSPAANNDIAAATAKPVDGKPVADTPENRSKLCGTLKTNLATLQGSGPVVMQQGDKTNALDADQRKQQLDSAQRQYDQYCQAK